MGPVECFLVGPTDRAAVWLRRYVSGSSGDCSKGRHSYRDAKVPVGQCSSRVDEEGIFRHDNTPEVPDEDPRWPTHCACGYEFADEDERQVFTETIYADGDAGREWPLREAPAGAMWDAEWMGDWAGVNGSGPNWTIRLPNGHDWTPGSRASNCGRRDEPLGSHDCWCVHGEAPKLTVDKQPEPGRSTCTAGAGSISSGSGDRNWHGFLRDGMLVR